MTNILNYIKNQIHQNYYAILIYEQFDLSAKLLYTTFPNMLYFAPKFIESYAFKNEVVNGKLKNGRNDTFKFNEGRDKMHAIDYLDGIRGLTSTDDLPEIFRNKIGNYLKYEMDLYQFMQQLFNYKINLHDIRNIQLEEERKTNQDLLDKATSSLKQMFELAKKRKKELQNKIDEKKALNQEKQAWLQQQMDELTKDLPKDTGFSEEDQRMKQLINEKMQQIKKMAIARNRTIEKLERKNKRQIYLDQKKVDFYERKQKELLDQGYTERYILLRA